jgi:hypothetical protein
MEFIDMKAVKIIGGSLAGSLLLFSAAQADHNSVWGEGWANMPNDIHNTRIETLGEDGTTFRDFVQYGNGADSVNSLSIDATSTRSAGMGGSSMRSGLGSTFSSGGRGGLGGGVAAAGGGRGR